MCVRESRHIHIPFAGIVLKVRDFICQTPDLVCDAGRGLDLQAYV